MKRPTPRISFVLESVEEKERIIHYAKSKGLKDASSLARFALYSYINRYPLPNTKKSKPKKHSTEKSVKSTNNGLFNDFLTGRV